MRSGPVSVASSSERSNTGIRELRLICLLASFESSERWLARSLELIAEKALARFLRALGAHYERSGPEAL